MLLLASRSVADVVSQAQQRGGSFERNRHNDRSLGSFSYNVLCSVFVGDDGMAFLSGVRVFDKCYQGRGGD